MVQNIDLFNVGTLFLSRMCEVFSDPPHALSSRTKKLNFIDLEGNSISKLFKVKPSKNKIEGVCFILVLSKWV